MIGVLLFLALGVYVGACLLKGFGPVRPLGEFEGEQQVTRRFGQASDVVRAAYTRAAQGTPGMSVVEEGATAILIDLRPTSRIMSGNFGLAIRVTFEGANGGGSLARAEAANKVPFALANHQAAFVHAESALRMRAKRSGIDERLDGVGA